MNVVSIMAHADDEMGCLGTMLKCSARGDRLHFVTLTDGSKGFVQNPGIAREDAARIRAVYINLEEPDEFLYDTPEVRMKLIEAIRKTGAQLIFTHYSEDYNQDHITVNRLVHHCAMQSCLPVLPTQSPTLRAHPAVFMCAPAGAIPFPASYYVDIGAFHAEKARLLLSHASQETAMQMAIGSGIEAMCVREEAWRGEQAGCQWAECFAPMPGRGSIKPYPVLP
jgi:LmbE family N-acetylglucosaminyl deacetylase